MLKKKNSGCFYFVFFFIYFCYCCLGLSFKFGRGVTNITAFKLLGDLLPAPGEHLRVGPAG